MFKASETEMEENKLLNKNYPRSFIILQVNHWCQMDYFNNVLITFLGLERGSCVAVYAVSESSYV